MSKELQCPEEIPETLYNIVGNPTHPNVQQADKFMKSQLSCHTNFCMMLATYLGTKERETPLCVLGEEEKEQLTPDQTKFTYGRAAIARRRMFGLPIADIQNNNVTETRNIPVVNQSRI